jgi:acetylglutamate kinase
MSVSQAQLVLQTDARGPAMDGRRRADLTRRVVVVKYGGAAMSNDGSADAWAKDIASLVNGGSRVVVVHGGGPALTRTLQRMGIESSFVDGQRVTSPEAAVVAEMVLAGTINKQVVARLGPAQELCP